MISKKNIPSTSFEVKTVDELVVGDVVELLFVDGSEAPLTIIAKKISKTKFKDIVYLEHDGSVTIDSTETYPITGDNYTYVRYITHVEDELDVVKRLLPEYFV